MHGQMVKTCFVFGLQLQHIWLYNSFSILLRTRLGSRTFAIEKDWTDIIWNNCEIRIDNKPGHYKKLCYEAGIVFTQNLLFNLNVADAYNRLSKKSIQKVFYIPETFTSHLYKK